MKKGAKQAKRLKMKDEWTITLRVANQGRFDFCVAFTMRLFALQSKQTFFRGVLFIVRAGNDVIKSDFMHTKRKTFPTKMKIAYILKS